MSEGLSLGRTAARRGAARALSDRRKGFYLLAEAAGRVVGQLFVTREWSDWHAAEYWWIQSVYVRPAYRRAGVFAALLSEVRRLARKDGSVRSLRLYVHEKNRPARAAYASLGFQATRYRILETEIGCIE
ncbi:MAG: GNAT family N-acetyltransferase [Myxococcales bacterium]|nr:GNAT family N-acetyltransferase [Myxococcales bacterium]